MVLRTIHLHFILSQHITCS